MILVAGATGLVGGQVCAVLASNGESVRALVRSTSSPEKVARLQALGVDVVEADLRDVASLDHACAGAEAVISTVSSMPFAYEPGVNDIQTTDRTGVTNLIDAAKRAAVQHFVYTSFSGNLDRDFPLARAKRAVEAHLVASGIAYTILRPSFFMEVWLSPAVGFDPGNGTATIYGEGTRPVSYIATKDVEAFAVASLTAPAARNAVLELGGPQALSQLQAVDVFATAASRPIATESVPESALEGQLAEATDDMQKSFISLMLCLATGDPIDMGALLTQVPIALTSVAAYAQT
jgi:uncharacterized protein YbjT (DUF2867 family)